MKKELIENFELHVGKCEKSRLRHIIFDLLGDFFASENSASQKVDERVDIMIELGDPEFISDLRHLNGGLTNKFDTFWSYAQKYFENTVINETILVVDERRHDTIQHLAQAISIRDLRQQVTNLCPPDTEIPSEQWDYLWLVFMDEKHRCKVGEPGYPVAAVERGKQVIVSCNKSFVVSDHDFTKCGIIPSVTNLQCFVIYQ
ncbi:unnamed protein product [Rhizophagus irregularis]|nr:unnamed protein product [Rhizophagus irregularis]